MKLICKDKVINLEKFETVQYRESLLGNGYPVSAVRRETSGGLFGGTCTVEEEIARLTNENAAEELVKAITEKWIADEKFFDVEQWINDEK